MSNTQSARGIYWIGFIISLVACILMLMFANEWFWITLPTLFLFLIKGMDWM